jgi:hypothetical protein
VAYCTQAQVEAAVGGADDLRWLTDPTNVTTDTAAVTSAIEAGAADIDSYATGTPGTGSTAGALWSSTPLPAKHGNIALAVYYLYVRIRREEPPPMIVEGAKRVWEQLKALAAGELAWVVSETPAAQNVGTAWHFGAGSTARSDNPRRTLRTSLDKI